MNKFDKEMQEANEPTAHQHQFTVPIQMKIDTDRPNLEVRNVTKLMCEWCNEVKEVKYNKYG